MTEEEIIYLRPEWRIITIEDLYRDLDPEVARSLEILSDEGMI